MAMERGRSLLASGKAISPASNKSSRRKIFARRNLYLFERESHRARRVATNRRRITGSNAPIRSKWSYDANTCCFASCRCRSISSSEVATCANLSSPSADHWRTLSGDDLMSFSTSAEKQGKVGISIFRRRSKWTIQKARSVLSVVEAAANASSVPTSGWFIPICEKASSHRASGIRSSLKNSRSFSDSFSESSNLNRALFPAPRPPRMTTISGRSARQWVGSGRKVLGWSTFSASRWLRISTSFRSCFRKSSVIFLLLDRGEFQDSGE